MLLARIAVPAPLGRAFSYTVPEELRARVKRGARVLVELGRRRVLGVVLSVADEEPEIAADKLKPIRAVVDPEPVLPEELLGFLQELARYYIAPIGEVVRLALPAVERSAKQRLDQLGLLEGAEVKRSVGKLVQVAVLRNSSPAEQPRGQAGEILEFLGRVGSAPVAELSQRWGNARAAVGKLEALGCVAVERREREVSRFEGAPVVPDQPPELTEPQARAVEAIVERLEARASGGFLLHGVTGSGKTEVYLRAAARCLELGGGVLVLVPEIALTPQLVARFRARLGDGIAVLHSGLGDRDRHAMWRALRRGEVRVAVGARSALFAPVPELRLVCVDEEHDGSFKQDEGVRYGARDMALLRAHRAGAVCVLGSATPALETVHLARTERLRELTLPLRARSGAALPEVKVVDLRRFGPGPTGERLITLPLHRALESVLAAEEQAILFLNRRGFAPAIICEACGVNAECPSCSVALTYHRRGGGRWQCHYCDFHCPPRTTCARCGSSRLSHEGIGTERVEHALGTAFPSARIARLDRDVAAGAKSERILDRVRRREVDILVGTQMVTKGHDLPVVTLVGVLNADSALSMPDFRAAERTFQLLVQVAGRAGRGEKPGTVIIQTRQPEHAAVSFAAKHRVEEFVERELHDRRELGYPPFSRLALIRVDAVDEAKARSEAMRVAGIAREASGPEVAILGPAPAPIARLRNRYRFGIMLRARARKLLRPPLLAVARAPVDRRVRVAIDVDPDSML